MINLHSSVHLLILGYCEHSEGVLIRKFLESGPEKLTRLKGEYTLVFQSPDRCTIITSPVGAMHYYYTLQNGAFFHGDKISDILQQSKLPWRWNWDALGDLCQLENVTANQTLHPEIHRVPPGSILQFRNGHIDLRTTNYLDTITSRPPDPDEAVHALNEDVADWAGSHPYLSLSGGFDSRVILSSLLKQGIQPHLITMGDDDATDVRVARDMAATFGLPHELIRLQLSDLFTHADAISDLTNGTKTAWHWHTYLYPLKAAIPFSSSFFVGTLGEFARSYYFDRGILGMLADRVPSLAVRQFWRLKLDRHPTFEPNELSSLTPELARQLDADGRSERAQKLSGLCRGQFLAGLTRYYFEQRVPNFYANGIKMYLPSSNWRSPFHSRRWIDAIWSLPFRWKLGSNWHRYAIAKNCPRLLEFPEENGFDRRRMLAKAPPLYWTPPMRRAKYSGYNLSESWYRDPRMQAAITDNLNQISDLIDPSTGRAILAEHAGGRERTRTIAFLLTMIQWKQVVNRVAA